MKMLANVKAHETESRHHFSDLIQLNERRAVGNNKLVK